MHDPVADLTFRVRHPMRWTALHPVQAMKRKVWYVLGGILLLLYLVLAWSRDDYNKFSAQREDWHRRCDAYVGTSATVNDPVRVEACEREAQELLAYAKRKGWAH